MSHESQPENIEFSKTVESDENLERLPSSEVIANFLGLTVDELNDFRQRLGLSEGHLRIWVHPLYTEQWPKSVPNSPSEEESSYIQNKLKSGFLRAISSVTKNPQSSPLLVYEAANMISNTRDTIASSLGVDVDELGSLGVAFIPTENYSASLDLERFRVSMSEGSDRESEASDLAGEVLKLKAMCVAQMEKDEQELKRSFPHVNENPLLYYLDMDHDDKVKYENLVFKQAQESKDLREEYLRKNSEVREEIAKFIRGLYETIGVESALVAGTYMTVDDCDDGTKRLGACAGNVVTVLREMGIPTDISTNIWPPKEEIKQAEIEVKQTGKQGN